MTFFFTTWVFTFCSHTWIFRWEILWPKLTPKIGWLHNLIWKIFWFNDKVLLPWFNYFIFYFWEERWYDLGRVVFPPESWFMSTTTESKHLTDINMMTFRKMNAQNYKTQILAPNEIKYKKEKKIVYIPVCPSWK